MAELEMDFQAPVAQAYELRRPDELSERPWKPETYPDLRYIVEVTDITDPMNPVVVGQLNIPAPLDFGSVQYFAADLPAAWFQQDHEYQVRVFVDPVDGATPPHLDAPVNVTTTQPFWWFVTTYNDTGNGRG